MKKQVITLAALAGLAMGATIAHGYNASGGSSAGGGIVGSKHNMNLFLTAQGKSGDVENRVCAFCHTPHHAIGTDATVAITDTTGNPKGPIGYDSGNVDSLGNPVYVYNVYSPLWSRDLSQLKTSYDAYKSATFDPVAAGKAYDNLIGPSRLCMTCHDGVVAADAYYGQTGTAGISGDDQINMFASGNFAVGLDKGLSNDHPIGFKYNDFYKQSYNGYTDYELRDPTLAKVPKAGESDLTASGKTIQQVLWTDPTSNINGIDNAFVTCASCHDVHNGPDVGNTNPVTAKRGYFLRGTQNNSYFCLTCHDKNR